MLGQKRAGGFRWGSSVKLDTRNNRHFSGAWKLIADYASKLTA